MILEILASCYMTWDARPFLAVEDDKSGSDLSVGVLNSPVGVVVSESTTC